MTQDRLARRLRVLRAERGLSLTEAAERIGVTRDTLSEVERGKRHPYVPTLTKIAAGYEVPVEGLLEEPVLAGKAEASETGLSYQDDRRAEHLKPWTFYVHQQVDDWESEVRNLSQPVEAYAWLESIDGDLIRLLGTLSTFTAAQVGPGAAVGGLRGYYGPEDIPPAVREWHEALDRLDAVVDAAVAVAKGADEVDQVDEIVARLSEDLSRAGQLA